MPFLPPNQQCQSTEGHCELETTINFLSAKLAISRIDTIISEVSNASKTASVYSIMIPLWKTYTQYTDAILQVKLIYMYVIFIRCDKRTSNNKHKKQSQNDVQYKAAKPKKL